MERGFFAQGKWLNSPDDFESVAPRSERASLGITYVGRDVYAVLGRATKKPIDVVVTRDGKPVPPQMRGRDVHLDSKGRTIITIDQPRMYYVVTKENEKEHELRFLPSGSGVRVYSFTFGNKCQENFDRL